MSPPIQLNSVALGEIALSYGENAQQPSPLLPPVLSMIVNSDDYRRRFRQAAVGEILTGESFWQLEFEPGPDESWNVLMGTSNAAIGAADDMRVSATVINPIDNNIAIRWADIIVMKGESMAWCGVPLADLETPASYAPENIFVPAGATLRIQTSKDGGGPFGAQASTVSLFVEVLPRQIESSKVMPTASVVS